MTNEQNSPAVAGPVELRVMQYEDMLERWELFRVEMKTHQERLGKLAISFIELEAFDDAAKCAIKADGIKYVIGRMPTFDT
jgi:hypothetical protein